MIVRWRIVVGVAALLMGLVEALAVGDLLAMGAFFGGLCGGILVSTGLAYRWDRSPDDGPLVTRTGRVLTAADVQALADEAERGYCTVLGDDHVPCFRPNPCDRHPLT